MSKLNQQFESLKACVLLPTYNNAQTLAAVIESILEYTDHLIVVNDGATDETPSILKKYENIVVINFENNKGKGMALISGFDKAVELGYHHAISIDSDGQHKAKDLITFLDRLEESPDTLLVGARNMASENVPGSSSFGNKFSNFWYKINTGIELPDTQSGYRSYPVQLLKDIKWKTSRFEFEIEVLVRADWNGIKVDYVPVDVYYAPAEERISHFRKVPDFTRISILNTVFVVMATMYIWPKKIIKGLKKKGPKEVWRQYFFDSSETNLSITLSIFLGVFIGITPFWGYQVILIIIFAQLLKLNKAIALIAGHISIPPMIPFILFGSYYIGGVLFGNNVPKSFSSEITFELVKNNVLQYVFGAFALALISAVVISVISFIFLSIFRRKSTVSLEK